MATLPAWRLMILATSVTVCSAALPQPRPSPSEGAASAASARVSAQMLKGTWIRPDGGYRIVIQGVGADGQLDATYFNPSQLPFARAQVSQDATSFRVVLELQAGGYAGSVYDLVYEAATDRLKGTFYQAVAKQKFDVFFVRKP